MKRKHLITPQPKQTKTIYYAIQHTFEVPVDATEQEIDDLVCQMLTEPTDYIWSDKPNLFWED